MTAMAAACGIAVPVHQQPPAVTEAAASVVDPVDASRNRGTEMWSSDRDSAQLRTYDLYDTGCPVVQRCGRLTVTQHSSGRTTYMIPGVR